jgi:dipeptidyl aminopeptidase/acylaminoacyl peptidase
MNYFRNIVLLTSVFFAFSCNEAKKHEVRTIPISDFFRNPDKTYLQISPDGEYISYLQPYQNRLNVFVENIKTKKVRRLTSETKRGIVKCFWANNNQILYLKDNEGDEYYHLYSVAKDSSITIDLTPFDKVKMWFMEDMDPSDNEILIALNKRRADIFDLYQLNTQNGSLKMLVENPGNISEWMPDNDGKIRLVVETDGVNKSILFRDREDQPFKKAITLNFKEMLNPIGFTKDNKNIYASSNIGRDKAAIVEFDLSTGKEKRVIFSHPDVDVYEMVYSCITHEPLYCAYTTWKYENEYLNPKLKKFDKEISAQLKSDFYIVSFNQKEDKFLLRTYTDKSLGAYYLFNTNTEELIKICEISPWINPDEMADIKPISFQSRDGLKLNGYLTVPKGSTEKNLPLIVNPHGGPWLRNKWGFNSEAQFLANRGYAVLQVNYRGSSGYGKAFWQSGFKEIGRKTQDDLTDGVRWLIDKGIADSNRIGIFGFSFGGYFALNGVCRDPEMYSCAISYCGLTNLFAYLKDIPPYYKPYLQMTYEMIGNPEKDADYFREYSPGFHSDKIDVPVLIAQGAKDPRVSAEEVNLFVKTLKKQGVKVTYILKQDEGHGFQNEENKIEFYSEMESFLNENLMRK